MADHHQKLDRAETHLSRLKAEVEAYIAAAPYTRRVDILREERRIEVWAVRQREMPAHWSLVVGDIIHNTRSALDHLVWSLCQRSTLKPTDKEAQRIQFPAFALQQNYLREGEAKKPGPRALLAKFLEPSVLAVIDAVQPYQLGEEAGNHPLAMLNRLSNEDKHRNILVTAEVGRIPRITFRGFNGPILPLGQVRHWVHNLGPENLLMAVDVYDMLPLDPVEVEPDIAVQIMFDASEGDAGKPVRGALDLLHTYIRRQIFAPLDAYVREVSSRDQS